MKTFFGLLGLFYLSSVFSVGKEIYFGQVIVIGHDTQNGKFIVEKTDYYGNPQIYFVDLENGLTFPMDKGCLELEFKEKKEGYESSFGTFKFYEYEASKKSLVLYFEKSEDNLVQLEFSFKNGKLTYISTECKPTHRFMTKSIQTIFSGKTDSGLINSSTTKSGKIKSVKQNVYDLFIHPTLPASGTAKLDLGYLMIEGECKEGEFVGKGKITYPELLWNNNDPFVSEVDFDNGLTATTISSFGYHPLVIGKKKSDQLLIKHRIGQKSLLPEGPCSLVDINNPEIVLVDGFINPVFKLDSTTTIVLPNGEKLKIHLKDNLPYWEDGDRIYLEIEIGNLKGFTVNKDFNLQYPYFIIDKSTKTANSTPKQEFKVERYLYNASDKTLDYSKSEVPFLSLIINDETCSGIVKNIVLQPHSTFLIKTDYIKPKNQNALSDYKYEGMYLPDGTWTDGKTLEKQEPPKKLF